MLSAFRELDESGARRRNHFFLALALAGADVGAAFLGAAVIAAGAVAPTGMPRYASGPFFSAAIETGPVRPEEPLDLGP